MTQRPPNPARTLELRARPDARGASAVLIGCAAIHALLLAGTWLFSRYYRDPTVDWRTLPWVHYGLVQLNLASENVLASWYGSILLLATACVACACFLADRTQRADMRPKWALWGWIVIAAVLVFLSFDEMGSLHERFAARVHPLPGSAVEQAWFFDRPIAMFAVFCLVFGWARLRAVPWAFPFLVLGLVRLLAIPFHEQIELALRPQLHAGDASLHQIAILLEENTELFGSLCLLAAFLVYLTADSAKREDPWGQVAPSSARTATTVTAAGLVVGVFATLFSWGSPEPAAGNPANWFAAAAAFLVAIALWQVGRERALGRASVRRAYTIAAAFALLMSAYVGANVYAYGSWASWYVLEVALHAALAVAAISAGILVGRRTDSAVASLASAAVGVVVALGLTLARPWVPLFFTVGFGLWLATLPLHLDSRSS